MTLCVTFSLVAGIVWVSSDSSEDTLSATAARGPDPAGGGRAPFPR
ncbi:class F sortase, partial [Streptomyces sp. PGLac3x]